MSKTAHVLLSISEQVFTALTLSRSLQSLITVAHYSTATQIHFFSLFDSSRELIWFDMGTWLPSAPKSPDAVHLRLPVTPDPSQASTPSDEYPFFGPPSATSLLLPYSTDGPFFGTDHSSMPSPTGSTRPILRSQPSSLQEKPSFAINRHANAKTYEKVNWILPTQMRPLIKL